MKQMNTIKRDVYVLKNTIKIPIEVTKGTDAITFEFTVRDYNLPATAAAVAYAYRMGMKKPNSTLCDVSGNVISFQPSVNFFEVGNNELQIRVINGDKSLISFKEKVKCSDSMGFPDEEEEENQSLIEQIIAQSGKESGERKAADEKERSERKTADETEKSERIAADAKEKSERQKEIATERARIDQLTKMGEGSTTGDAELADIRVGNEGATYSNAGNAVRSQTKDVPAMMDNLQSPYVDISLLEQGSLNNTGTEITSSKVLRSVEFHWNKNGKITAPSGYKIAIANYAMQSDESGQMLQVYQSATDYGGSQTSSKADGDAESRRLLIKRSDGADINAEDLRGKITTNVPGLRAMDVIENLEKKIKTDATLEKEGIAADAAETGKRISKVKYKTKNLKPWNLADISKAKQGYAYHSTVGKPLEQIENANYILLDEVYEVEAGKQYTVNWLYGNLCIYDNAEKIISANYIDSIPFTVTIPDGGVKMTLFGGPKRMVDIMLVEGNEIPDEYIPHSIFDIESKKDYEQDKILESILHPLKGVKWCAYGNSLTDSATLAGQTTGTKNYVDYVSESLGLNVVNCGSGGTGFLKNNNKGTFVDRVSSIPLDTEILTVFGSFNDYEYISEHLGTIGDTGTDTIYGAIYNFIHDVYTRCPNAIIGIITPTKWGYLSDWKDASAGGLCDSYVEALLKTADKWSIPVLDLYHDSGLRPWDSNFAQLYYKDDDGNGTANTVHPLDAAHKRFIAPKVEAFIKQIYHVY